MKIGIGAQLITAPSPFTEKCQHYSARSIKRLLTLFLPLPTFLASLAEITCVIMREYTLAIMSKRL